jgi:hypothetical protein
MSLHTSISKETFDDVAFAGIWNMAVRLPQKKGFVIGSEKDFLVSHLSSASKTETEHLTWSGLPF